MNEQAWNLAERCEPIPNLQLELKDDKGLIVYGWWESDPGVWWFNNGIGTGRPIVEWRYRKDVDLKPDISGDWIRGAGA